MASAYANLAEGLDLRSIFERELGQPKSREDRHGWATFAPPGCHKSKSGRSFAVNLKTGGWLCRAGCGKGGDVISFIRWRHQMTFPHALKYLGIDSRAQAIPKKPQPKSIIRRLAEAVVDGPPPNAERDYRVAVREELHQARRRYQQISERLAADRENQELWHQLQIAHCDVTACEELYTAACEVGA